MDFEYSERTMKLRREIGEFMDAYIYPNEDLYYQQLDEGDTRWDTPPILEELKAKAKSAGLWNLFLPESEHGAGLSNYDYAHLCEVMGRSAIAPQIFNCAAPDTGNMEVLERVGTPEQKEQWLKPLLNGEIRSAYIMTEPDMPSSDAKQLACSAIRDGDEYVITGEKYWSSGAGDPRCKIMIVMVQTDPDGPVHRRQSQILVPRDTPGVEIRGAMHVFGEDDAPHGHMHIRFNNVRVPASNMLWGEGKGFEISQDRKSVV